MNRFIAKWINAQEGQVSHLTESEDLKQTDEFEPRADRSRRESVTRLPQNPTEPASEQELPAELHWRVEGMRNLLPEPGQPIPLLVASESAEPKIGECYSCAQPLPSKPSGRSYGLCGLCEQAIQIVLRLGPEGFVN